MLIAGAYGAVLTVTASLLSRGLLERGERGPVVAAAAQDDTISDVDRAVVELVRASPAIGAHAMFRRLRSDPVIDRLGEDLVGAGLRAPAEAVARLRRLMAFAAVLLALGVGRIVGVEMHVHDAKPPADNLGIVPFMLTCAVWVHGMMLVFVWPGATAGGLQLLARLRECYHDRDGPVPESDLAYAVALHGPNVLRTTYPDIAGWVDSDETWHAQRR